MADIVSGLAALKTAFDLAKDLKNATSAYNDAEMRLKFSELYSALSDAKIDLADAQIEMFEMKQNVSFAMLYIGVARPLKARQMDLFAQNAMKGLRINCLQ